MTKQMTNQIQIIEDLFSEIGLIEVDYTTHGNVTDVIITSGDPIDEDKGIIIRLSNTDFYQVSEAMNINDPYMWDEEFVSFEEVVDWIENNYL